MEHQTSTPAEQLDQVDVSMTARLRSPLITAIIVLVLGLICLTLTRSETVKLHSSHFKANSG